VTAVSGPVSRALSTELPSGSESLAQDPVNLCVLPLAIGGEQAGEGGSKP